MKILITGGSGFIGSHIAEHHLQKKDSVWVIDNLSSGKKENLANFSGNPDFQFDEKDILSWEKLETAVSWADRIYHMAALVGQKLVLSNLRTTLSSNIRGCENILQAIAHSTKKQELLIASSSSVYNNTKTRVDKEDAILHTPSGQFVQEAYQLSKLVNEVMALSYAGRVNFHCCIARIFNTIGPRQRSRYGMVVPSFVQQAIRNEPITIYGNGKQTRSFCNIHDTIQAFELLFENPESHANIVNVGNDREISIKELALLVKKLAQSSSKITYIPYKEAYGIDFQETWRRKPSLKKLRQLTGFKAKYSLEQTIKEIIATESLLL